MLDDGKVCSRNPASLAVARNCGIGSSCLNAEGEVGDMACDLLGKPECVSQIRKFTEARNPVLRKQA